MKLEAKKRKIAAQMTPHKFDVGMDRLKEGKKPHLGRQSGIASKEIPKSKTGKNEGNKLYEGKNEQERQ